MDKFLPFLYEKKKINKFEQKHLYLDIIEYPLQEIKEDENKDQIIIIEVL